MSGDLFVLPFSLDDIDSYNQVKHLCQEIRDIKKSKQDYRKTSYPILILGNKLDCIAEQSAKTRCIDSSFIEQFASTVKSCTYSEASCKTSKGLEEAFQKIFTLATIPSEMLPNKHRRVYLNFDISKPSSSSSEMNDERTESKYSNRFKSAKYANDPNSNSFETTTNGTSTNFEREGSFKKSTMKNIKRMTFRRTLNDAKGVTQFNARRPSIQTELNLLQNKSKSKNLKRRHSSRLQAFTDCLRKLLCFKLNDDTKKKVF